MRDAEPLTRRRFVATLADAAMVAGPLALCAACGGGGGADGGTTGPDVDPNALPDGVAREGEALVVRLARVPALARAGGVLLVAPARVLVTRPDADRYLALDATCPHAGSLVARIDGDAVVCPAHQSAFALDGRLLRGPADQGLRTLPLAHDRAAATLRIVLG